MQFRVQNNKNFLYTELENVYLAIVYCKDNAYEQLIEFNEKYNDKFESIDLMLANYIALALKNIYPLEFLKFHQILEQCLENMSNWQKLLYYQYYGYYLFSQKNCEEALKYYKHALSLCVDDINRSMVYYHMGLANECHHDLIEAFSYNHYSTELFHKTKNFRMSIHAATQLGGLHCQCGKFETGIKELLNGIETMQLIGYKEGLDIVYLKLIWFHMVNHDYETARSYLEESYQYNKESLFYYFHASWIYYLTNDIDKAKYFVNESKKINGPTYIKSLIQVAKYKIENKPETMIVTKLENIYDKVIQKAAHTIQEFVLDLLLNEYKKTSNYEKLYYYSDQMISIYRS